MDFVEFFITELVAFVCACGWNNVTVIQPHSKFMYKLFIIIDDSGTQRKARTQFRRNSDWME